MIITLGVMLVTGSLLVAAFTSGIGEVRLTNTNVASKKAYYAAQAGISEYAAHMTQTATISPTARRPHRRTKHSTR